MAKNKRSAANEAISTNRVKRPGALGGTALQPGASVLTLQVAKTELDWHPLTVDLDQVLRRPVGEAC